MLVEGSGALGKLKAITGTAGVSPASSRALTQATVEYFTPYKVAFHDGGRDARGLSNEVEPINRQHGQPGDVPDPFRPDAAPHE